MPEFTLTQGGESLVIELGYTKGGSRRNVKERVVVRDPVALLHYSLVIETKPKSALLFPEGMPRFRRTFAELLSCLGLDAFPYKPYSLRRGGATLAFMKSQNYNAVMETGRWMNLRTAKIYIYEASTLVQERVLPTAVLRQIKKAASKFDQLFA